MKKILVTGGTGYIGSHTVVELQQAGFEVLIVDNLSNSEKKVLVGIEKITKIKPRFFCFDLCNEKKVKIFFAKNKIDAVIHFAALKAVGESIKKPLKYYQNNLVSTLNILQAVKDNSVEYLVFSSSATVYGKPDQLPISEEAPIKPAINPYGATKQMNEQMIIDLAAAQDDFKGILLRYFNPIGAHPTGFIGEQPSGVPDNLVPFITQTAIGIRQSLKIFGNDYQTVDGTCIRDYLHVVDLAKAHVIALKRLFAKKNKKPIEIYNLGTGKGTSVLEMIKIFEQATKEKVNYEIAPRRAGDVEALYCDPLLANTKLGWKAKLSVAEALKDAWRWEQKSRELSS